MPTFVFKCVNCKKEFTAFAGSQQGFGDKIGRVACSECLIMSDEHEKLVWKSMPSTYMETIPDEGNELKH